jgi:hypothetical protein
MDNAWLIIQRERVLVNLGEIIWED